MGILTRAQEDVFVITSDRAATASPAARAPARLSDAYHVWTGTRWSIEKSDALRFDTLDAADEYVRANFARIFA